MHNSCTALVRPLNPGRERCLVNYRLTAVIRVTSALLLCHIPASLPLFVVVWLVSMECMQGHGVGTLVANASEGCAQKVPPHLLRPQLIDFGVGTTYRHVLPGFLRCLKLRQGTMQHLCTLGSFSGRRHGAV